MDAGAIGTLAAGDAAAEGALDALEVCPVLRREGIHVYAVVEHGSGYGNHGDMVGRGA